MILFRYSKLNGGEYISHLDTLRHINRTLKRANIDVAVSEGFNHHAKIFMSNPIGVGMKSISEYCTVETNCDAVSFVKLFNEYAPKNIRCEKAIETTKNINVAGIIDSAIYSVKGINYFDVADILNNKDFIITNKKGEEVSVRERIISLEFVDNVLMCHLKFGNENVRADLFVEKLKQIYGGQDIDLIKIKALSSVANLLI